MSNKQVHGQSTGRSNTHRGGKTGISFSFLRRVEEQMWGKAAEKYYTTVCGVLGTRDQKKKKRHFFFAHLAENHKRRVLLQLSYMLNPIVISVKRGVNLQIDLLGRIQPLAFRVLGFVDGVAVVVGISGVIVHGHTLGSVSVSLVEDVVQGQV